MNLGRRDFLRLSLLAGLISLSSCASSSKRSILLVANETLPKGLIKELPPLFGLENVSKDFFELQLENHRKDSDFVVIGDGWLNNISDKEIQFIDTKSFHSRFSLLANNFLNDLPNRFSKKIFPLAFSPWVMIFRNGGKLIDKAIKGWDVLLEPELNKKIILPNSPRLIISLAQRIGKKGTLNKLLNQAKVFDGQNGLNWLLNGNSRVAILPLQYCLKTLNKDQRLKIVIPQTGAPLNWTLLLHFSNSKEPLPSEWIEQIWSPKFLSEFLRYGLVPPLNNSELEKAIKSLPDSLQNIFTGSSNLLNGSWSLPPLSNLEIKQLQQEWEKSIPESFPSRAF